MQNWEWIQPEVQGDPPPPRTGHTAVVLEERYILISGGYNPFSGASCGEESARKTFFDDMYLLDTTTWTWSQQGCMQIRKLPVSLEGVLQELEYDIETEPVGYVWSSALKVNKSYLTKVFDEQPSSLSSSSSSLSEVVVTYGGLALNETKSKNFGLQLLEGIYTALESSSPTSEHEYDMVASTETQIQVDIETEPQHTCGGTTAVSVETKHSLT